MMYLTGTDDNRDLRRDLAEWRGSEFSLRLFHGPLLEYGSIPIRLIAEDMCAIH